MTKERHQRANEIGQEVFNITNKLSILDKLERSTRINLFSSEASTGVDIPDELIPVVICLLRGHFTKNKTALEVEYEAL